MPTKKKQLQQYQIKKILQEKSIILFYQCNHVNKKEWELVKKGLLSTLPGVSNTSWKPSSPRGTSCKPGVYNTKLTTCGKLPSCKQQSKVFKTTDTQLRTGLSAPFVTLLVKNRLGHRCATSVEKEHWSNLLQGPTLLFACNSHYQMLAGCNAIAKNTNWHSSISLLGGIYYGKLMTHLDFTKLCKLDQEVYAVLTSSLTENVELLLSQRLSFYQSRLLFYLDCHAGNLRSRRDKKVASNLLL